MSIPDDFSPAGSKSQSIEDDIAALMKQTLKDAALPNYNIESNKRDWWQLGQEAYETGLEKYKYANVRSFEQNPIDWSGRAVIDECLISLENFSGVTGGKNINTDLPCLSNINLPSHSAVSFISKTPNLQSVSYGFFQNWGLKTFVGDLSCLTSAYYMFGATAMTEFSTPLPKLTSATGMFSGRPFKSWNVELPVLNSGKNMFQSCSSLVDFTVKLPKLSNGQNMFDGARLNVPSVVNILSSIPFYSSGSHPLHIGSGVNFRDDPDGLVRQWLKKSDGSEIETPIPADTNYKCFGVNPATGVFMSKGWTITVS